MGGGTNDRQNTLKDFYKLDINNNKWEQCESMLERRESFFMTSYKSKFIIVAGGFDG